MLVGPILASQIFFYGAFQCVPCVPAYTDPLVNHFFLGQIAVGGDSHQAKHVDQIQVEWSDSAFSPRSYCLGVSDKVFRGGLKAKVKIVPLVITPSVKPLSDESKKAGYSSASSATSKGGGEERNGISFQFILRSLGLGAVGGLIVCWPMVLFVCVRLWIDKPWR